MKRFLTPILIILPALFFVQCKPSDKGKIPENEAEAYRRKGAEIVRFAGDALQGQLKKAIADTGIIGAIDYCHIHAMPILDSAGKAQHVIIRRTSSKVRNPANKPDAFEKRILKLFEHAKEKGTELKPQIGIGMDKRVNYYHPIEVKGLCLNCHGSRLNGLGPETYEKIVERYPKDKAINYSEGDFRGMWVVTFADTTSSGQ